MRALLLAGGEAPPADFVRAHAADLVICADGGLRLARLAGLAPDLAVGDFDSVEPAEDLATERHPTNKDASDLELALEAAVARGATHADILGALGGRLDHELFNVWALLGRAHELGIQARLLAPGVEVFLAAPGRHAVRGDTCSLLPLDDQARLTLEGFEYPLRSETLRRASTRGLSNRVVGEAWISVEEGRVLVIVLQGESR